MVAFEDEARQVKLSLRQADILEALASDPELIQQGGGVPDLIRGEERFVKTCGVTQLIVTDMFEQAW